MARAGAGAARARISRRLDPRLVAVRATAALGVARLRSILADPVAVADAGAGAARARISRRLDPRLRAVHATAAIGVAVLCAVDEVLAAGAGVPALIQRRAGSVCSAVVVVLTRRLVALGASPLLVAALVPDLHLGSAPGAPLSYVAAADLVGAAAVCVALGAEAGAAKPASLAVPQMEVFAHRTAAAPARPPVWVDALVVLILTGEVKFARLRPQPKDEVGGGLRRCAGPTGSSGVVSTIGHAGVFAPRGYSLQRTRKVCQRRRQPRTVDSREQRT